MTNAKLIDGRVYVEQADGRFVETAGTFDHAAFNRTTEADLQRMAAEDGEDQYSDPDEPPNRVSPPIARVA